MSATGNELVKLSQLRGTINGLRTDLQSANLTNTNTSIIQTTGGSLAIKDGQELVKQVSGQSYVWNQLINKANYEATKTVNGITFTKNNDGSITANGTTTADAVYYVNGSSTRNIDIPNGHKFLLCGCPSGGSGSTYFLHLDPLDSSSNDNGSGITFNSTVDNNKAYISIIIKNGTTVSNLKFYPQVFDLTAMGLGNITTVAQFKALFPNDYYPYSAPTLVSSNNEYKNTNADSTKSALLSYNGTLERKVGSVKLKDLTTNYASSQAIFQLTLPSDAKTFPSSWAIVNNVLTNLYTTTTVNEALNTNKTCGANNNLLWIKDTTYTDTTAFKNHFTDDDILYYELATPTTETIVNATNVELKGVGTAKDTLYNESGLASWKNGLTEQVNKNGIVAIPYSVSEEFAVSINGQLQHNLEVDKSQQEEIQEIDGKLGTKLEEVKASNVDSESATSGQVLTADGSGGASWQSAGGGTTLNKYSYSGTNTKSSWGKCYRILVNAKSILSILHKNYSVNLYSGITNDLGAIRLNGCGVTEVSSEAYSITINEAGTVTYNKYSSYDFSTSTMSSGTMAITQGITIIYWNDAEIT